jgi:hypothetical protein
VKILSRLARALLVLAACLLQPAVTAAVTLGQIDDFQDGTTQNWAIGATGTPATPVNIPDGGPAGAGDAYLLLTALGSGSPNVGNRLSVINETQWAGNYLAAGVNAVGMMVKNLGSTDLSLRLLVAVAAPQGFAPTDVAISTKPVFLQAGSGWTAVVFPIAPANLTALAGSVQTALGNAAELRIFHNPAAGFPGPRVVASLGVDDIHAVRGVPLPYLPLLLLDDCADKW